MKKSEMLNEMTYIIRTSEDLTDTEIAESILELQIELGMLPPTSELEFIRGSDNCWEKE